MKENLENNFKLKIELETEEEKKIEELKNFLEKVSLELIKNGFPVQKNCQIDMVAFERKYSQDVIKSDKENIQRLEKQWYGDRGLPEEKKIKRSGEQLEMLKTAIFHKFLRKSFFVLRSAFHDDIKNKVDNIIIEKETGNIVCAFDEVASPKGKKGMAFKSKREKIYRINLRGGARLKYGLNFKRKEEETEITLTPEKNIPIFYLALLEKYVKEGLRQFVSSVEEKSEYEKRIFNWFIASIKSQIAALELELNLDPILKERLESFKEKIDKTLSENEVENVKL